MAKSRAAKIELGHELADKFSRSKGVAIAEYAGMTAEQLAYLRRELRAVGCEFKVVKNRVARKAVDVALPEASPLKGNLVGPVGVVYIYKDIAEGAKTVVKFSKEIPDKFKLTSGMLEGKVIAVREFQAIAELPSKDVLLAKIVGSLVAPHRRLLGALNGVSQNLVRVIAAIKEKKSS
jgi:large subunit ribosomal protein L10